MSMGIFRRASRLESSRDASVTTNASQRFRIKVTTADGRELYWHKQGQIHTVEEDVADTFIARLNRDAFEILPDGHMTPPVAGESLRIAGLEKEPV